MWHAQHMGLFVVVAAAAGLATLAEVKTGEAEGQEGLHLLWKLRMTGKDQSHSTLCGKACTP